MSKIELFPKSDLVIGSFKGFAERGFEFAADLVIPYRSEEITQPQLGSFLLVQLSSPEQEQASLGRITKILPFGRLASPEGEDYIERMRERESGIPKEIKERMIRYRVQIKLLGVLRGEPFGFMPSQRRLPHLGAKVAWPSHEVLKELCKLGGGKTFLGHFALGEFIYCGKPKEQPAEDGFVRLPPELPVTFDINNLVARRTAVFARAGYGKSNLIKYLVSELYRNEPKTDGEFKRPVGMLIFDADGEYFWPDSKGLPGLCDVPHLCDKIAVFSKRQPPDPHYGKWLAGNIKMDIRQLNPRDVFSIALTPERQEQQNVLKLKAVKMDNWKKLVNLVAAEGMGADNFQIGKLLGYKTDEQIKGASAEIGAAVSNVNNVVHMLHDPDSNFLNGVMEWLKKGKIAVADISLLSAKNGEIVAGLLMRKIFSKNQEEFTGGASMPVIAVIEEAQRTLGGRLDNTSPFVEWVKEGRKYDLGAVLVTQQPGSISGELLSQVDNWFCFHLLSEGDAGILGKYNSHFSADILSHMIAEPIKGNCFMWSAPDQPFVLPVRVHEFRAAGEKRAPAVSVKEEIAGGLQKNKDELIEIFKSAILQEHRNKVLGLKEFEGGAWKGIKSGKIFNLIKNIRQGKIEQGQIDDWKKPLFEGVLGGNIKIIRPDGGGKYDEYYCAPKEKWDEILGEK